MGWSPAAGCCLSGRWCVRASFAGPPAVSVCSLFSTSSKLILILILIALATSPPRPSFFFPFSHLTLPYPTRKQHEPEVRRSTNLTRHPTCDSTPFAVFFLVLVVLPCLPAGVPFLTLQAHPARIFRRDDISLSSPSRHSFFLIYRVPGSRLSLELSIPCTNRLLCVCV